MSKGMTVVQARDRGQHDRRRGVAKEACPFTNVTRRKAWIAGWEITFNANIEQNQVSETKV